MLMRRRPRAVVPVMGWSGLFLLLAALLVAAMSKMNRVSRQVGLALPLFLLLPALIGPHYSTWVSFENGSVANVDHVNQNFISAAAALDEIEERLADLELASSMFLTDQSCPDGCWAVEDGYLKLGGAYLTTTASNRTLQVPGHGHSHSMQAESFGGQQAVEYACNQAWSAQCHSGTIHGAENVQKPHSHAVVGTVGAQGGASGDLPAAVLGDLEHVTSRLCVKG